MRLKILGRRSPKPTRESCTSDEKATSSQDMKCREDGLSRTLIQKQSHQPTALNSSVTPTMSGHTRHRRNLFSQGSGANNPLVYRSDQPMSNSSARSSGQKQDKPDKMGAELVDDEDKRIVYGKELTASVTKMGEQVSTESKTDSFHFPNRGTAPSASEEQGRQCASPTFGGPRRKISYTEIVQVRKTSQHRKKSQNLIDYLGLDVRGGGLSALMVESAISQHAKAPGITITPGDDDTRHSKGHSPRVSPKSAENELKSGSTIEVRLRPDKHLTDKENRPLSHEVASSKGRRRKISNSYEPNKILENAIALGYFDLAKGLVESKQINTNKLNESGFAPLHQAAFENRPDMIKLLVDNGAYIDIQDTSGFSPLQIAVNEGCFECAQILIAEGADQSSIRDGYFDSRSICKKKEPTKNKKKWLK